MSNFAKAQAARELTFQQLQTKNNQLQQCLNVAVKLLKEMGANIVAACFIIDLPDLQGRKKIEALGVPVRTLMQFEGH